MVANPITTAMPTCGKQKITRSHMPLATKYLFFASMDVAPDKEALFNEV